jgi:hypothetical protein
MIRNNTGSRKSGKSTARFSDVEFRDLALTAKQEAALIADGYSKSTYLLIMNSLLADGYKVTLKVDQRNSSVMAMVQDAEYDPQGTTILWVMRSGTAAGAMLKLCYYLELSNGVLPDALEQEKESLDDSDLFA